MLLFFFIDCEDAFFGYFKPNNSYNDQWQDCYPEKDSICLGRSKDVYSDIVGSALENNSCN